MSNVVLSEHLVFLCDDDNDILEVTRIILEDMNCEVKAFSACEEITEAAQRLQPRLILLDLRMPKIGGETIARQLKKNPRTRHIPLYIFSADTDANVKRAAELSGADGVLGKPFEIKELEDIVRENVFGKRSSSG